MMTSVATAFRDTWNRHVAVLASLATMAALVLTVPLVAGTPAARADTAPTPPITPTVSADALPTVQINGVVWSQGVAGNRVYAGGNFTNARPAGAAAGTQTTARTHLLAYDITTGQLITSFAPTLNGQVRALTVSPDGTRLYVTGDFTQVNGQTRNRIAAFNAQTGALIPFSASLAYIGQSITATNDTVYVGGNFQAANGVARGRLAAFRASDGALLNWAPVVSGGGLEVRAMTMSPDKSKVIVGGMFLAVNGLAYSGIAAIDAASGAVVTNYPIASIVKVGGTKSGVTSLSSDSSNIYGTAFVFGNDPGQPLGNIEGVFAANGNAGNVAWINDCHGDHYSAWSQNDSAVYAAGHAHHCGNLPRGFTQTPTWTYHRGLAMSKAAGGLVARNSTGGYTNWQGNPAPRILHWDPTFSAGSFTGQSQGPWNVAGNNEYVVYGGEFPTVNFRGQQGLVRFAVRDRAPNTYGPILFNADMAATLTSPATGTVRGNFLANYDPDNERLTYRVTRRPAGTTGNGTLIQEFSADSTFWNRPPLGFTDTGLTPGTGYEYRVETRDPLNNVKPGEWRSITVASTGTLGDYARAVLDDNPGTYWRLGEAAGNNTAVNFAGGAPGNVGSGVTRGATGAIPADSDRASTFNGTSSGLAWSPAGILPPTIYSTEAWFRTTTTRGGKIFGFGSAFNGASGSYDRHVYMQNNGRLVFGIYNGATQTVTSPQSYNNGQWHHVVATFGDSGMKLYVDGALVGTKADTWNTQLYSGYWRVGGDNLGGWPNRPTSDYFAGDIDEVAIYGTELSATRVAAHNLIGRGQPVPNTPPTAAFAHSETGLKTSLNAAGSSDPDGTIQSYAWEFGDGQTGTGVSPEHTYANGGTYPVKLTVTDDDGGTGTVTQNVTVAPIPNQPPTAAFGTTVDGLKLTVNGSVSADSDGTIQSYEWDFGDGGTDTGATPPDHTYAAGGTYNVTLTVTDDDGDTGTLTKPVTVLSPADAAILDAFTRSVTAGWGTADRGGPWTISGGNANFSVDGNIGRVISAPGQGRTAFLNDVKRTQQEAAATIQLDKAASGGGTYVSLQGRRIDNANNYILKVRVQPNGSVIAYLGRTLAGTETTLSSLTVPGLTYQVGDRLNLRMQATGTSPTTLRAKVWKDGSAEPGAWQLTGTDSSAALQVQGVLGLYYYLSGSSVNGNVTLGLDNVWGGPLRP